MTNRKVKHYAALKEKSIIGGVLVEGRQRLLLLFLKMFKGKHLTVRGGLKIKDKGLLVAFLLRLGICLSPVLWVWIGVGISASGTETLLQEDFNDGIAQGFGNEVGNWRVVDGRYTATTGIFRFSTVSESIRCDDYSLEADFIKARDGGFLVRAQDGSQGVALIVRPTHNDIYWSEIYWPKGKGRGWGARHEVKPLGHKPGEDLHVKVEVRGDDFKAYVNGEIKTVFRSTEFPKPKIALYLYRQSDQYWDNVVVRSLTAPPLEEKG